MKIVILCRVSSKEQEETGYSLPAQEKFLSEYANKKEFEIDKVFSISESASGKKQREIFNGMMTYIDKTKTKVIIIEKIDRLTRNFKDAVMIDEWLQKDGERQVHFVKNSLILHKDSRSQEKMNWGINIVFSKNYIDNLSEEVKKGQAEKIAQGGYPTKPPVGYITVGDKGRKDHIVDQEKAPMVRKMFDLYATGNYSLKRLTELMYSEGLRNLNGNKIVKSRIHDYLKDPFYIGKMVWKGVEHPGKHEPLISEELFEIVQRILKSKTTPKYSKHNFLFKGTFHCSECKGLITWEIAKGHIYGHCNHYHECSQSIWVKEPDIETQLVERLKLLEIKSVRLSEWLKKALKESHQEETSYHSQSVKDISKQHEIVKQRLDRLFDEKLDGKIDESYYQRRFQEYSEELKRLDKSLGNHSNATLKYHELSLNFFDISQRASQIYYKGSVDQRRLLLRMVFEELFIGDGLMTFKFTKPFQILYEAVKQTNGSKLFEAGVRRTENFEPLKKTDGTSQSVTLQALRPNLLEDRNVNITSQLARIFIVFEDFRFISQLREEMEKIQTEVINL